MRYIAFDYKPKTVERESGEEGKEAVNKLFAMESMIHGFCKQENIKTANYQVKSKHVIIPTEQGRYERGYWLFCQLMSYKNHKEIMENLSLNKNKL